MGKYLAIALTALLATAGLVTASPASGASTRARILIVGDSVTQGAAGDYTWRYRLWKTLQRRGKSVNFVGPRKTLADGSTDYKNPAFDQDHAARWGAKMTTTGWWVKGHAVDVTRDVVRTYAPDVVIDDLGVNNIRYGNTPEQVIALVRDFVADVRAVKPHAAVVLGQLTQRWFAEVDSYNALLSDLAASLDQPDARVLVARVPSDYTVADTYDSSHPTAEGEKKIAAQFSAALATLSLPDKPSYSRAASLAAQARHRAVRLDFTFPRGATKQAIWRRDVTADGRWKFVAYVGRRADHYRVHPLRHRHLYVFRLRAYRGSVASSRYSNKDRARVR